MFSDLSDFTLWQALKSKDFNCVWKRHVWKKHQEKN